MRKILGFVGLTAGSYIGWWIGAVFSIMAAVLLSFVGTGIGLYVANRIARAYF